MSVAALLPERVVVALEVPSLFGGLRLSLKDVVRCFDPVTLEPSSDGVDVARLLSLVEAPGQARRIAGLCRRLADSPLTGKETAVGETAPLSALMLALVQQLGPATSTLAVPPQTRAHARFGALLSACETASVTVTDLRVLAQPSHSLLLLVDEAEVLQAHAGGQCKTIADAGQSAMLAAGLCHDVAAFFVEAAGAEGKDVFDKGFDDLARACFVQRIERTLRRAQGGVVRMSGSELVPPLSSSTSKLSQLGAEAPPKVLALAATLRAMQEKQRQALVRINLELRLPPARDSWWQEKLASFGAGPGDVVGVVGMPSPALTGLQTALMARGSAVESLGASWLHRLSAPDAEQPTSAALLPLSEGPAPRSVGGVRQALDFDASVPTPLDEAAPSSVVIIEPPHVSSAVISMNLEPREVELPSSFREMWVWVDGQPVDPADLPLRGPASAPTQARQRVRLDHPVRHGSVVVVAWDDDGEALA